MTRTWAGPGRAAFGAVRCLRGVDALKTTTTATTTTITSNNAEQQKRESFNMQLAAVH